MRRRHTQPRGQRGSYTVSERAFLPLCAVFTYHLLSPLALLFISTRPPGGEKTVAAVWREPSGQQFQSPPQLWRRQVIRAGTNGYVVPETVDVLSRRPRERGTAVTLESLPAPGAGTARQQRAFLLKRLFVDLTGDSFEDLTIQQAPIWYSTDGLFHFTSV